MKLVAILLLSAALIASALAGPVPVKGAEKKLKPLVTQGGEDPDPQIRARRNFVKGMMKDAFNDYVKWAYGNNELKPVSQTGQTGGIFGTAQIGATIVDSIDSLFIMELMDEYELALNFTKFELSFDVDATISVFETNIRFVGGFLTAFALTNETIYRDRAYEIATLLLPAFDTPSGLPYSYINIKTGENNGNTEAVLAEFGTLHLEFLYLSDVTGDPIFREKALAIRKLLKDIEKPKGQYWNFMDVITGKFTRNDIRIGALGDSFYEYLLKEYIRTGDQEARDLYDDAMDGFVYNGLVKVSKPSNLVYIAESHDDKDVNIVGHLACFAGGMFALGAHVNPDNRNAVRDAEIGANFTNTCHESYIRTATHIGPEVFWFSDTLEAEAETDGERAYILRPEVIESYMILYRITGDPKYREWGWDAVLAIERYSKAGPGRGYSGLKNTNSTNPVQDDVQQTFFLAETLKYLYLLFSTNDLMSLDEWVFNTECHPLPIQGVNPLY